jgi:hypothetical protein
MPVSELRLALKAIQGFKWPNRSGTSGTTDELLRGFVAQAALFVDELRKEKREGKLHRRSERFIALTNDQSAFANARRDALAVLSSPSCDLHIPDRRHPIGMARRRRVYLSRDNFELITVQQYRNSVDTIAERLTDENQRFALAAALADAESLLGQQLKVRENKAFKAWHQAVLDLNRRCQQEHLLGCYLLKECHDSVPNIEGSSAPYYALLKLLIQETQLIAGIKDAAAYLYYSSSTGQGQDAGGARATGFHEPNHPRPAGYDFGPLQGKKNELANAICKHLGMERSARALQRLNADGLIWVVEIRPQLIQVHFKDKTLYAKANGELLSNRNQHTST